MVGRCQLLEAEVRWWTMTFRSLPTSEYTPKPVMFPDEPPHEPPGITFNDRLDRGSAPMAALFPSSPQMHRQPPLSGPSNRPGNARRSELHGGCLTNQQAHGFPQSTHSTVHIRSGITKRSALDISGEEARWQNPCR